MEHKITFIKEKLHTESNQIIKTDSYNNFFTSMINYSIEERFILMTKVAIKGHELGYDENTISNCKLHLKTKAFSGITGSITEKNINYIYDLVKSFDK